MASRRSPRPELLVGLFATISLGLLTALLLMLGKRGAIQGRGFEITARFADAQGVLRGSPVRMSGADVGEVIDEPRLLPSYDGVEVRFSLVDGLRVPVGSRFRIRQSGLLGDTFVLIEPPPGANAGSPMLADGAQVEGERGAGLTEIAGKAGDVADEVGLTAAELRLRLEELESSTANLDAGSESLRRALERLERDWLNDANAGAWSQILAGGSRSAARIEEASTRLPEMMDRLDGTLRKADSAAETLVDASRQAGGLIADARPAVAELRASLARVGEAADELAGSMRAVRRGEGLVPSLLQDPRLRDEFRDFIYNLRTRGPVFYRDEATRQRNRIEENRREAERDWQRAIDRAAVELEPVE